MNKLIRGFSLVEVMIAGALALLFALSISDLIIDVFRVSMITQQKGEVAENAQYLIRLLKQDIQMAGFFGNKALDSEIVQRPNICSSPSQFSIQQALLYPLDGINNSSTNQRLCGRETLLSGSDILLLRQGLLSTQSKPEQLSAWKQTIYYVADDGSFKRRRYSNLSTDITEPLIEGVDDFQVEYGIRFNDQHGTRTEFIDHPQNEQQWEKLVAVRFYLLLSSTSGMPHRNVTEIFSYAKKTRELNDGRQHNLITVISLVNNLDPKTVTLDIAR